MWNFIINVSLRVYFFVLLFDFVVWLKSHSVFIVDSIVYNRKEINEYVVGSAFDQWSVIKTDRFASNETTKDQVYQKTIFLWTKKTKKKIVHFQSFFSFFHDSQELCEQCTYKSEKSRRKKYLNYYRYYCTTKIGFNREWKIAKVSLMYHRTRTAITIRAVANQIDQDNNRVCASVSNVRWFINGTVSSVASRNSL